MKKMAAVIGASLYQDSMFPPLPAARADAEKMAEVLGNEYYGYNVSLLLDEDATRANVLKTLFELHREEPDDFVFFFAGHGAKSVHGASIVLHDATEYDHGISMEELAGERIQFAGANVTAILDCCHSGALRVRGGAKVERPTNEDLRRGLIGAQGNISAIAACLPEEVAFEYAGLGHGLLTFNLLEGMGGLAADSLGRVTPTSLYTFVAALMREATGQTPCFRCSVGSDCYLGGGFKPREVDESNRELLNGLVIEAQTQYEDYMSKRARAQGLRDRQEVGFSQDCRLLEEKLRWLEKTLASQPQLASIPDFRDVANALRGEQAYLGNVSEGTRIPGGLVASLLGSGGFGSVWLVEMPEGEKRAFKVYHPNELWDQSKVGRFQTGYRANRQLSHPNIVEVFDERLVPLGFFMQAIDGPNLRDAGASTWDASNQLRFLIDVAETIGYAHDHGVIHRDIKPENILVRWEPNQERYEPVISDFDLAWFSTATQRTQAAMGMAFYAPPEQRDFVSQDAVRKVTVDIFSLAQVAFFLFSGRDPLVNQTERNVEVLRAVLLDSVPASSLSNILDFYRKSSQYDPAQRFSSMNEVGSLLRSARSDLERAKRGDRLTVPEFLRELVQEVSGHTPPAQLGVRGLSMSSKTGRTEVVLEREHDQGSRCGFDFRFRPTGEFGISGSKNADLRKAANQQLDRSLARALVPARRRSGQQGAYEVFVDVDPVPLTADQVAGVADVCLRAIRVMEGFS